MTRVLRALGASAASALMLGPAVGLLLGSIVVVGTDGEARPTAVGWGLTLSDPHVGLCLWNSLATTGFVVASAAAAGVAVARIARGLGPRGRSVAGLLVRVAAGCHPCFAAIGLVLLVSASGRLAGEGVEVAFWKEERWRWLGLAIAQFGFASGWVAWWTGRALDRIRADWLLVATLSGAPRGWIWRTSVWPLIRPTVARASASAFSVLLIEPGAPIVLGLRRTLAGQIVGSAWMTSRADWPRAATLAGVALLIAVLVRLALIRWGGPDELPPAGLPAPSGTAHPRSAGRIVPDGRIRSAGSIALLSAWLPLCLVPALAVIASSGRMVGAATGAGWSGGLAPMIGWAAAFGATASVAALLLAWPLSAFGISRTAAAAVEAMPPLAIGVGLLCLRESLRSLGAAEPGFDARSAVAGAIDPYRSPGLLAAWGTALAHLPWAVEAARRSRRIDAGALQDVARMAGDRRARSRTVLLAPIGLRRCLGSAIGVLLIAAAGLSPALVLAPLEPLRPIGPWVLLDRGVGPGIAAVGLVSQILGVALLLRGDRDPEAVAVLRT